MPIGTTVNTMNTSEKEKNARLNEIGKMIADMFPNIHGQVTFNYQYGKYTGKARVEQCIDTKK